MCALHTPGTILLVASRGAIEVLKQAPERAGGGSCIVVSWAVVECSLSVVQ